VAVAVTAPTTCSTTVPHPDIFVTADEPTGASSFVSPKFSTVGAGELLIAMISANGAKSSLPVSGVSGAGLNWSLVKRSTQAGGTAEVWQAFAAAKLNKVAITAKMAKMAKHYGELTVIAYAGAAPSIGASSAASASSGAPSVAVTP